MDYCPYGECILFGQDDAPPELAPLLREAVERHVRDYDVTEFVVGGHGAFDRMAADAVRGVQQLDPEVRMYLLSYAYNDDTERFVPDHDGLFFPEDFYELPPEQARPLATKLVLPECTHAIVYVDGTQSRWAQVYKLARKQEARGLLRLTSLIVP